MTSSGLTLFTEIVYGISGISGLASNFLVVYIILFCLNEKTRNFITTRCILHLALCDLIVTTFIPFLISDLRYKAWPYSAFTCSVSLIIMFFLNKKIYNNYKIIKFLNQLSIVQLLNLALLTTHFTKSFLLIFFGLTTLAIFKGIYHLLDCIQLS